MKPLVLPFLPHHTDLANHIEAGLSEGAIFEEVAYPVDNTSSQVDALRRSFINNNNPRLRQNIACNCFNGQSIKSAGPALSVTEKDSDDPDDFDDDEFVKKV